MLSHAGYSPGRHLPLTLYLATSWLNLHSAGSKKKVQDSVLQLNPPGLVARPKWGGRQLGHSVVISLYTWFILPVWAICACLASSQTFVACSLYNPAFAKYAALFWIIIIDAGHLGLNWILACLSYVTACSYVLAQSEWKRKDQSIRRQFPTILRERICLFCPSQRSFPNSVIKPNNISLCCPPSKDRGLTESGDGKCFVNKVVYSESDTEATKTLSRLLLRECCCAARLALI